MLVSSIKHSFLPRSQAIELFVYSIIQGLKLIKCISHNLLFFFTMSSSATVTVTSTTIPQKQIPTTAFVVEKPGAPFKLQEVVLDEVRSNEVLVEMKYTGLCHTVSTSHSDQHRPRSTSIRHTNTTKPLLTIISGYCRSARRHSSRRLPSCPRARRRRNCASHRQ